MRYPIAKFGLLVFLIPLLMSCNIEPEDKWPVITDWSADCDLNVHVTAITPFGFEWNIPKERVDVKVKVRTYNANQGFKVTVILERLRREFTYGGEEGDEDYPFDMFQTPVDNPIDDPHGDPTEVIVFDNLAGTYVPNSGKPPQGVTELSFFFYPNWTPYFVRDWYVPADPVAGTADFFVFSYVYRWKVIVEDSGGRSDWFTFTKESTLVIDI